MENGTVKIDLGSGRNKPEGYIGIDRTQIIDGNGDKRVDILMDIEVMSLPFEDNTVFEVRAMNVLEHLRELCWVMNECHRVLKPGGRLIGVVPVAGTVEDFKDPTHQRHFIKDTFAYFMGENKAFSDQPSRPKYANYGFLPWNGEVKQDGNLINFNLTPRK